MYGSGFITQIIYAALDSMVDDSKALLTENNFNILTESGQDLDTE